jgi:hypothetical protein
MMKVSRITKFLERNVGIVMNPRSEIMTITSIDLSMGTLRVPFSIMTHYDKLIDTIKDHLYQYYVNGIDGNIWNESETAKTAQSILKAVEEFQNNRAKLNQWRASD